MLRCRNCRYLVFYIYTSMGEMSRHSSDASWTISPTLQVADRAEHLGSGLLQRGLKVGTDTFVGIFAQNRPEVTS